MQIQNQVCLAGRINREIDASTEPAPADIIRVTPEEMKHIREYNLTEWETAEARKSGMSYEIFGKIKMARESTNHLPTIHRIVSETSRFQIY